MMKLTKRQRTCTIDDAVPERPQDGDFAFRVVHYDEGQGVRVYEVYAALFMLKDGESGFGPQSYLEQGDWGQIGGGMGVLTIEDVVAQLSSWIATAKGGATCQ